MNKDFFQCRVIKLKQSCHFKIKYAEYKQSHHALFEPTKQKKIQRLII